MTDPPEYDADGQMLPGRWNDYGVGYYDRQGNRITMDRWCELNRDPECKRVAATYIGNLWISTVWLGMNHRFMPDDGTGLPIIFETMVFADEQSSPHSYSSDPDDPIAQRMHPELRDAVGLQLRYATEEEAIRGHDLVCIEIRTLMAKIEMAQQIHDAAIDEQIQRQIRKDDKE